MFGGKYFFVSFGLFFAAKSIGAGARSPQVCTSDAIKNQVRLLAELYVPMGHDGGSPAYAAYLVDKGGTQRTPLLSWNENRSQAVASVQKIVTAYVAFTYGIKYGDLKLSSRVPFKFEYMRWDDQGYPSRDDQNREITHDMARANIPVSVSRLIHNLLYWSANGSASALADAAGGSQENFVELMNQTVRRLLAGEGSDKTYFQNPHGLTDSGPEYRHGRDPNRRQQSTAKNMLVILNKILNDQDFVDFLQAAGIKDVEKGDFDKKGVTVAAGTTVVRSIGLPNETCAGRNVLSVMFGRQMNKNENPNQAQDFNTFHKKLKELF